MNPNAPRAAAYVAAALAGFFGGASLLLFAVFMVVGPLKVVDLSFGDAGTLLLDGALSLAFFVQHSVMIRSSFRQRVARVVPDHLYSAVYAVASGIVLLAVVVLWQEAACVVVELRGALWWVVRGLAPAAAALAIWGVRTLKHFDTFGIHAVLVGVRGEVSRPLALTAEGPYRWMRHPLYLAVLMVVWSYPILTADRLLFNASWTVWVVVGTALEERDLVAAFGDSYRAYQRRVPMLIPWRIPRT